MTQKKVENKAVAPLRKLYVKSNDPDDSVPVRPSVAKTSHEVKGTLQEDEKRRPLYLATTASMRTKTLPTKKYVKRESRLPPRMMLRKHEVVSSVLVEGKERKGAVPAAPEETVVVSQNPASTEATAVEKQKETMIPVSVDRGGDVESSQVKEKPVNSSLEGSTSGTQKPSISTSPDRTTLLPAKKEKKATQVISSVYHSALMK